ncbi:uncharacterized protein G2W53_026994 [Senna tora]|uniref:Uncharacterized protein n=1 Tax=Senna tora TaxID=362788 RepID=A0A834WLV3_9FABA|nr:uncharacterized protein G2W53_026994 [Senna tora]
MAEARKRQADALTQMMQHIQEERNERALSPRGILLEIDLRRNRPLME